MRRGPSRPVFAGEEVTGDTSCTRAHYEGDTSCTLSKNNKNKEIELGRAELEIVTSGEYGTKLRSKIYFTKKKYKI